MAKIGDIVYDALTAFLGGVNSGINPILLRRDQLAYAVNATVRGGFISPRPPFRKMTLSFGGDDNVQTGFERGYFQGGCAYRPDFGDHSLLPAISGRLYQMQISGNSASVSDVSVAGDPNSLTANQCWLWQAENYVIWNDGQHLPVFFNGTSSRRSRGESVVLATVNATSSANPPAIGATVNATLTAPYAGQLNIPVLFNNATYEVSAIVGGDPTNATLTNTYATAGATITAGSQVLAMPSRVGRIVSSSQSTPGNFTFLDIVLTNITGLTVGGLITFALTGGGAAPGTPTFPYNWTIQSINPATNTVTVFSVHPTFGTAINFVNFFVANGEIVTFTGSSAPNVSLGTTVSSFVVPAVGGSVDVQLSLLYSGANGTTAWIGNEEFTIAQKAPGGVGAVVTLINLSDTDQANPYSLPENLLTVPELPIGRMGCYVMGRVWMSLVDGISFIAGNIVGGEGGTVAEAYRNSILCTTENDYLNGGGTFRLPGSGDVITAMIGTANLDASLGQGPVQVFTARSVFTLNAPVDRTTWQDLTFPILSQSLIGSGALAQQSTFQVNSDTFFRALDGWRSLILARRDFSDQWGNTPMTREVERVLNQEDRELIPYTSGVQFDNRALFSAVPNTTSGGIASNAIVALNLDPVSNLAGKSPPVWEGSWTGLNPLQLFRAVVDNEDRSFALHLNPGTNDTIPTVPAKIELYELMDTADVGDSYSVQSERILFDDYGDGDERIEWSFETAVMLKEIPGQPLMKLEGGEMTVEDVVGEVDVTVQYRPDGYPCWTDWIRFSLCAEQSTSTTDNLKPGYQSKAGFGEPSMEDCDPYTNMPLRLGHRFQLKFLFRGHLRFLGCKIGACIVPELPLAKPVCRPQNATPQP